MGTTGVENEAAVLRRRLERERKARRESEAIAERGMRELYDREQQVALLSDIAAAANRAASLREAMQFALDSVCAHTGWPVGHVYVLAEDSAEVLVSAKLWHLKNSERFAKFKEVSETTVFASGVGLPGRVLASGKPAWIVDVTRDANFPRAKMAADIGVRAGFGFPVLVGTRVAAVMEFFSDSAQKPDERLLALMANIGTQIGRVAERMRAEVALSRSEQYFRALIENASDIITILDANGVILYESPSVLRFLGWPPEEFVGRSAFEFVHPEDQAAVMQAFQESLQRPATATHATFRFKHKDGAWRVLEGVGHNLLGDPVVKGVVFNSRDITEARKLEEQFRQSQKMEAIGQLAGGVAHDFNNLLTVILGYSERLQEELRRDEKLFRNIDEVHKAALRASELTRQLLAFSRKQPHQMKVLDVNAVIANMDKMLRRLIGEDVKLQTVVGQQARVNADVGQLEQVIMNLCVNARDAMPNGGNLTIETATTQLDENYARQHLDVKPGNYVVLSVTDTGHGMSEEVKRRIFEPFFTTKGVGKGTGLGLATCFGIVKQSGGHIGVYSEVGKGTTFKIYLPRAEGEPETAAPTETPSELPRGTETLLVVEDEPSVRMLTTLTLAELGYTVIEAENGHDALRAAREHKGKPIDILLTDVVMPEMGGRELSEKFRELYPRVRVLFTSGYAENAILQNGVIENGVAFLQKPFTAAALARKLRETLDGQ